MLAEGPDRRSPVAAGPLTSLELAHAGVMAGLCAALVLIAWYFANGSPLSMLAVVPLGVVVHRHRMRALVAATVTASLVVTMMAGIGPVVGVVDAALLGGLVGVAKRREWRRVRVAVVAVLLGLSVAAATDGAFAVLTGLRHLVLQQVRDGWEGVARLERHLPVLSGLVPTFDRWVADGIRLWWVSTPAIVLAMALLLTVASWVVLGGVLARLSRVPSGDRLAAVPLDGGPPGPVPVELDRVGFRYPGTAREVLTGVDMALAESQMVTVVGHNGSGKSTLSRIVAGVPPTSGEVRRAGAVALGRTGGTAVVQQHPETQVLGVRVADDVVWGLPTDHGIDVDALLADVGLAGTADRETTTLSGGQLQRLAVAAALARRPRLLVSDESTAMVDPEGRRQLVDLLRSLPGRWGTTVVHVTHRPEEVAATDRIVQVDGGRLRPSSTDGAGDGPGGALAVRGPDVPAGAVAADGAPPAGARSGRRGTVRSGHRGTGRPGGGTLTGGGTLQLAGVGHCFAEGTPWAQRALDGVDLTIGAGSAVLVSGTNGSGKSTLAWIMAGLLQPTEGVCLLDGRPVTAQVGRVGLAFQNSRLQLLRATVRADLCAASGLAPQQALGALALVGLDPAEVAERGVDELSGGQLRRVAIAGLLARRPRVLVLDEPLAGLDGPSRDGLTDVLADLRRSGGPTMVIVTHDVADMAAVADRTIHLDGGRVAIDGSPR